MELSKCQSLADVCNKKSAKSQERRHRASGAPNITLTNKIQFFVLSQLAYEMKTIANVCETGFNILWKTMGRLITIQYTDLCL